MDKHIAQIVIGGAICVIAVIGLGVKLAMSEMKLNECELKLRKSEQMLSYEKSKNAETSSIFQMK